MVDHQLSRVPRHPEQAEAGRPHQSGNRTLALSRGWSADLSSLKGTIDKLRPLIVLEFDPLNLFSIWD